MSRRLSLLICVGLMVFVCSCSTAGTRKVDHRLAELEMRVQKLESPQFAKNQIPTIPENLETVTPAEIATFDRKMPKVR